MKKVIFSVLAFPILSFAGSLDPAAGPAPTMVTLQEIYDDIQTIKRPITLSDTTTAVAEGYYEGTDLTTVDADLAPENILGGVSIFGVAGTIPNRGAGPTITPTTTDQTVSTGYYNSDITVEGDANLLPENIAEGVTIFGVVGTRQGGGKVVATGGTIVDVNIGGTLYRMHRFTQPGTNTFTVTGAGDIDVLLVGGGGAGGPFYQNGAGGGGGGGRVLTHYGVPVEEQDYTIHVGGGGVAQSLQAPTRATGTNTVAFGYTALGGGYGGGKYNSNLSGQSVSGGNGGGGGGYSGGTGGGSGNRSGGNGNFIYTNGGGGAGDAANGSSSQGYGGAPGANGGNGTSVSGFAASAESYGGGGGGGAQSQNGGSGGTGGGGNGNGGAGTHNRGGGGGGGGLSTSTGAGGHGIVIVRYPL